MLDELGARELLAASRGKKMARVASRPAVSFHGRLLTERFSEGWRNWRFNMRIRDHKQRIYGHYSDRYRSGSGWMSAEDRAWVNAVPVGREIGSPDYERLSILDMYSWGDITEQEAMRQLGVERHGLTAMLEADGLELSDEVRESHHKAFEDLSTRHKTSDVEALKGMFGKTEKAVSIEEMNPLHRKP